MLFTGGTPLIIENAGVSRLSSNHTASPTTLQATSSQEQIVEKAKQVSDRYYCYKISVIYFCYYILYE